MIRFALPENTPMNQPDIQGPNLTGSTNPIAEKLQEILETLHDSEYFSGRGRDVRTRFWTEYEREAKGFDDDFIERYNVNLDSLLIFAGLFSAVSSAFIVDVKPNLIPDPADTTNALLLAIFHTLKNETPPLNLPVFAGPTRAVLWTQGLSYASLATSLLAAFGAVLGKQWLAHFKTSRFGSGSLEERCRRRHRKLMGLEKWHLATILDMLPILLQLSLFLFTISLSASIWLLQRSLGWILMVLTTLGIIFYFATLCLAVISIDSPFESKTSTLIRIITGKIGKSFHLSRVSEIFKQVGITTLMSKSRTWNEALLLRIKNQSMMSGGGQQESTNLEEISQSMAMEVFRESELVFPEPQINHINAMALCWAIKTSTAPDVMVAVAGMVTMTEWPSILHAEAVALQLWQNLLVCCDQQGRLIPGLGDTALAFCKPLIHLRGVWEISNGEGRTNLYSYRGILSRLGSLTDTFLKPQGCFYGLSNLDARKDIPVICLMFDRHAEWFFTGGDPVATCDLIWISHMLPQAVTYHLLKERAIPQICFSIITCCISHTVDSVKANGILSMALIFGLKVDARHLLRLNKSEMIGPLQAWILQNVSHVLLPVELSSCRLPLHWEHGIKLFPALSQLLKKIQHTDKSGSLVPWALEMIVCLLRTNAQLPAVQGLSIVLSHACRIFLSITDTELKPLSDIVRDSTFFKGGGHLDLLGYCFKLDIFVNNAQAIADYLMILGSIDWSNEPKFNYKEYLDSLIRYLEYRDFRYLQWVALRALLGLTGVLFITEDDKKAAQASMALHIAVSAELGGHPKDSDMGPDTTFYDRLVHNYHVWDKYSPAMYYLKCILDLSSSLHWRRHFWKHEHFKKFFTIASLAIQKLSFHRLYWGKYSPEVTWSLDLIRTLSVAYWQDPSGSDAKNLQSMGLCEIWNAIANMFLRPFGDGSILEILRQFISLTRDVLEKQVETPDNTLLYLIELTAENALRNPSTQALRIQLQELKEALTTLPRTAI